MSTFRTPVGPQPSRVYWRRRLVVGLGLLAIIVIVVLIVARPGASKPSPSTSATITPTARATSASTRVCDPNRVTVDAVTDSDSYAVGVEPVLSFVLKSTMTVPCRFSAGSDVQEFRITSGDELIWTSKDCQTDAVAATTVLQPGVPLAGPSLSWDRTRSSKNTCDGARPHVIAGGASYHLAVIVGDVKSTTTKQFLLQ
ncbi:MAG: hypothetical protein EPN91_07755 [Salinibacterium sp.]|nr:MAG: hypothetical protein EPN91_07755 [Salinibacterium sp.]